MTLPENATCTILKTPQEFLKRTNINKLSYQEKLKIRQQAQLIYQNLPANAYIIEVLAQCKCGVEHKTQVTIFDETQINAAFADNIKNNKPPLLMCKECYAVLNTIASKYGQEKATVTYQLLWEK